MTKIDIFSGFLGAGKTTLIKKLLKEAFAGEKIVLIENEFGEIGIDGGFLKDAGVQITEMNSGCICCSLVGDFGKALTKVLEQYAPDRILIEPSGVGKLSDVAKAVKKVVDVEKDVEMGAFVTVVDAGKCKMYMKNFGEFFNNQIENATTIILSRTQKTDEAKVNQDVEMIREHNQTAKIVTTPWDDISGAQIKAAMDQSISFVDEVMKELEEEHEHHHHHDDDEECCCGHDHDHEHHHHHHADEVFTSWGVETPKKFEKDKLDAILKKLAETDEYGMILRAKGMVPCTDGDWMYFDLTPEEYEIRKGTPDYTGKLCVIGSKLKEDELKNLFEV